MRQFNVRPDVIKYMPHSHYNSTHRIRTAFILNLCFTVVEIIGGMLVNSVAILSDALHDLGDSLALGISWYLEKKSVQKPTEQFSFGFRRFSLLGALISSMILITGSMFIILESVKRIIQPQEPEPLGMLLFAILGIVINGIAVLKLRSGKSLNERVVTWHLLEDVLGWFAVLVVSIVLLFSDFYILDPILSLVITLYVLWNVIRRLKETLLIFLQGTPPDIVISDIENEILRINKVESLHHTHVWSLDGEDHVFSTHVRLTGIRHFSEIVGIKEEIKVLLRKYNFSHCTIETELDDETCELFRQDINDLSDGQPE